MAWPDHLHHHHQAVAVYRFDPAIALTIDVTCASCRRLIPAGEKVRRTRGLLRHNGGYLCSGCWGHP